MWFVFRFPQGPYDPPPYGYQSRWRARYPQCPRPCLHHSVHFFVKSLVQELPLRRMFVTQLPRGTAAQIVVTYLTKFWLQCLLLFSKFATPRFQAPTSITNTLYLNSVAAQASRSRNRIVVLVALFFPAVMALMLQGIIATATSSPPQPAGHQRRSSRPSGGGDSSERAPLRAPRPGSQRSRRNSDSFGSSQLGDS